jgi:hypothetical protein
MPVPQLPPNFERYELTPQQARKVIGIGQKTMARWIEDQLIGYLRRPDGEIRFRLSDCYKAAGVPIESPLPEGNPQEGSAESNGRHPGVA